MDFFDQHMYLDTITSHSTDFETVLKENLGYPINVRSSCPYCKNKVRFEDISKIIKLPEILVFTIERYIGETNRIPIRPNEIIDVKDYVEKSMNIKDTIYELFAINIRFGQSTNFGHQICQIKKGNSWYTLNDNSSPEISELNEYINNSYGLFYKRITKLSDKKDFDYHEDIYNNEEITVNLDNKIKLKVKKSDKIKEAKLNNNFQLYTKWTYNNKLLINDLTFENYGIKEGDTIKTDYNLNKNDNQENKIEFKETQDLLKIEKENKETKNSIKGSINNDEEENKRKNIEMSLKNINEEEKKKREKKKKKEEEEKKK
jgi:hypothetical protein